MRDFANQCLDTAQVILSHYLSSVQENGEFVLSETEKGMPDDFGHAAFALGEFYRATQEAQIAKRDIIPLTARLIEKQCQVEGSTPGIAYAALALLSFGPSQERNLVWLEFSEEVRQQVRNKLMATPSESPTPFEQALEIAKAVARNGLGLTQKDDTSTLIDRFLANIQASSTGGYCDEGKAEMGVYDISGLLSFILIRQSLQLHANMTVRDRKLPALRTVVEKYLKILPDIVREDGLGWAYGRQIGIYGQMHCVSLILQALRDGWINETQKSIYVDLVFRLFQYFFVTYLDQEHGSVIAQDEERNSWHEDSLRMINFDTARYLAQWSRLAQSIGTELKTQPVAAKPISRYICFTKTNRKEHGLFIYRDPASGLQLQLPLTGSGNKNTSDALAFPHAPGIFDWPAEHYLPVCLPELTFGDKIIVPSFYGMNCTTSLGLKNSVVFRYDQPELITKDEELVPGLGSVKVTWSFQGGKVTSEFAFTMKSLTTLDSFRYAIALAAPHSIYGGGPKFALGEESLRANIEHDDFEANWEDLHIVSEDPAYRTYNGKIHYLQVLSSKGPFEMKPGQVYRFKMTFEPDIVKL